MSNIFLSSFIFLRVFIAGSKIICIFLSKSAFLKKALAISEVSLLMSKEVTLPSFGMERPMDKAL